MLLQVIELFGERRHSIQPIITDIAGILKRDANDHHTSHNNDAIKSTEGHRIPNGPYRTKRTVARLRSNDELSYHERKLNMTNFRGTAESNDQHAIESEAHIHVSLPNANMSHAMTLEEVENLALSALNGSLSMLSNSSISEILPEPEMLIRPYRVRPKPLSERFDNIYLYVVDYPM